MRGSDYNQSALFSYISPEARIPEKHPLRPILEMSNRALRELSDRFAKMYSAMGRDSVPPEQLMRALLLQVLYTIRSERMLMEQLEYNLLFRWFVGLNVDEKVWDRTVFCKNRDRMLQADVSQAFFEAVVRQAQELKLLSDEHFTVDGTLLEAWASKRSYQKRENPPEQGSGSRGETLLRDTHECKTDPDAHLYRKGKGDAYQLCHMAHILMENRTGLPIASRITEAKTDAEWSAAMEMLEAAMKGKGGTVGADAGYDYEKFVTGVRGMNITPHVNQHTKRPSMIDGRTTRHEGYQVSLKKRKQVEQIFGWLKTVGGLRKVRHRGRALVQWMFTLGLAAYNLVRLRNIKLQAA